MTPVAPSVRVGVDLTDVEDVRASIDRFGARYLERIYTRHELDSCTGPPEVVARSLAARFAAKEATFKLLRPRDRVPVWTEVEVRRQPGGWTDLVLSGTAAELAADASLQNLSLSLSHEGSLAIAVVVGTTDQPTTDQEGTS